VSGKRYDQEFKDNAAKYCIEKAGSITKGAEELGLSKCSIFKWVSDYKERHMSPAEKEEKKGRDTSKMSILEKELREAKRRNFELMEQNEILKKAVGIFSQHPHQNTNLS
jgi:Transposase.